MSTLKVNIPLPASRGSPQFAQALKVTLAATAYKAPVQYAKVPGATTVSLDITKENESLIESNAIVRYFAAVGSLKWSADESSQLKEAARIEWEERRLSKELKENKETALAHVEEQIATGGWGIEDVPGPSTIIFFSTLYDALGAAEPAFLNTIPKTNEWFTKVLQTEWARIGIETVVKNTTEKEVKSAPEPKKPRGPAVVKVKDDAKMFIPKEGEKLLPIEGQENVLITSALPYVNNVPHLGNIIGSVLSADVFSRYKKARNIRTLYICGTDEYGTATETKALELNCTPQELCDKYNKVHSDVYKWFDIGFDYFGRTSTPAQTDICQAVFNRLHANGYTQEDTMTQLYCEKHDGFLADRFVEGTCPKCNYEDARGDQCDKCGNLLDPFELINPRCKLDGTTPIPRDSKHLFLSLDKLQPALEAWSRKASEEGNWSKNGRIITENWLKEGLRPRCITRDLKWGVPVPKTVEGFENKVFYVWFDAPLGYPSITANYTPEWEKWWKNPEQVKLYQFMGKDNVPFHTVIFPGCEIGTGENWTLLHHISTAEYLQYENGKFSKSRGVGVFGDNAQATGISPSVWRYYLLSSRPETSDTQFLWRDFIAKNNSELLANLGNLVNRVVKFLNAKYDGVVPDFIEAASTPVFAPFKEDVNRLLKEYVELLDGVHIKAGLDKAMHISSRGNLFLQENKLDNNLFANERSRCDAVMGLAVNLIYLLSAIIYPYMPGTTESILSQLNAPPRRIPDTFSPDDIQPGHTIGKAAYLFSRIDEKMEEVWRNKYSGGQTVESEKKAEKAEKQKKKGKKVDDKKKAEKGTVVVQDEGITRVKETPTEGAAA